MQCTIRSHTVIIFLWYIYSNFIKCITALLLKFFWHVLQYMFVRFHLNGVFGPEWVNEGMNEWMADVHWLPCVTSLYYRPVPYNKLIRVPWRREVNSEPPCDYSRNLGWGWLLGCCKSPGVQPAHSYRPIHTMKRVKKNLFQNWSKLKVRQRNGRRQKSQVSCNWHWNEDESGGWTLSLCGEITQQWHSCLCTAHTAHWIHEVHK